MSLSRIDHYPSTNYVGGAAQYLYSGSQTYIGQSFTANGSVPLDWCEFFLAKLGSPTGNVTAYLYAHTGTFGTDGKPTGSPLATSDTVDVSTLTGAPGSFIRFNFASPYTLTNGTKYVIVVFYSGGNASNCLVVGADDSFPAHAGNPSISSNGTTWGAYNTYDLIFGCYSGTDSLVHISGVGTPALSIGDLTPTIPNTARNGDLMVALLYTRVDINPPFNMASGWQMYDWGYYPGRGSHVIAWRYKQAGDGNPTFTYRSSSDSAIGVIMSFSGANSRFPFENTFKAHFTAPTTPFDVTISAVTPSNPGSLALFLWGSIDDNTYVYQSGGGVQQVSQDNTTGTDCAVCIVTKEMLAAESTGAQVARQTNKAGDAGWGVSLIIDAKMETPGADIATLTDNFNDNSLDTNKWGAEVSNGTVNEQNNRLELDVTDNVLNAYARITSVAQYNLWGSEVFIKVPQAGGQPYATWLVIWHSGTDQYVGLSASGGPSLTLAAWRCDDGISAFIVGVGINYDSSAHRYWRIRESGNVIYWDYSADGQSWTNFRSWDVHFDLANVQVDLLLQEATAAAAGPAYIDDVNILAGSLYETASSSVAEPLTAQADEDQALLHETASTTATEPLVASQGVLAETASTGAAEPLTASQGVLAETASTGAAEPLKGQGELKETASESATEPLAGAGAIAETASESVAEGLVGTGQLHETASAGDTEPLQGMAAGLLNETASDTITEPLSASQGNLIESVSSTVAEPLAGTGALRETASTGVTEPLAASQGNLHETASEAGAEPLVGQGQVHETASLTVVEPLAASQGMLQELASLSVAEPLTGITEGQGELHETASTGVSEPLVGTGQLRETASLAVAEPLGGAGELSETASLAAAEPIVGTGQIHETASESVSEALVGTGQIKETASSGVSEPLSGAGQIKETASTTAAEPLVGVEAGQGELHETASTSISEPLVASQGMLRETASSSAAEPLSATAQGSLNETASESVAEPLKGAGQITEAVSQSVTEGLEASVGQLDEAVSQAVTEPLAGSAQLQEAASLTVVEPLVGAALIHEAISPTVAEPLTVSQGVLRETVSDTGAEKLACIGGLEGFPEFPPIVLYIQELEVLKATPDLNEFSLTAIDLEIEAAPDLNDLVLQVADDWGVAVNA